MQITKYCGAPGGFFNAQNYYECNDPSQATYLYDENSTYYSTSELSFILDVHESKFTYDDFVLLGGGIMTMFIVAWSLKQVRLIFNRT